MNCALWENPCGIYHYIICHTQAYKSITEYIHEASNRFLQATHFISVRLLVDTKLVIHANGFPYACSSTSCDANWRMDSPVLRGGKIMDKIRQNVSALVQEVVCNNYLVNPCAKFAEQTPE